MKDLKMRNLSGLAGFTVMRGAALVCVLSLVSMLGVIRCYKCIDGAFESYGK